MPIHSLRDWETGKWISRETGVPASPPAGWLRESRCTQAARGSRVPCAGRRGQSWPLTDSPGPGGSCHHHQQAQSTTPEILSAGRLKQKIGNAKHIHSGKKLRKPQDPQSHLPTVHSHEKWCSGKTQEMRTMHFPKENVCNTVQQKCYFSAIACLEKKYSY